MSDLVDEECDAARLLESLTVDADEKTIIRLIGRDLNPQDILEALLEKEVQKR